MTVTGDQARLLQRIKQAAGKTDQDAIREIARAAASPLDKSLEEPANQGLIKTATAFTGLLSQTFQAVAWNADALYDEGNFEKIYARVLELTSGFKEVTVQRVTEVLKSFPPSLLVFRLVAALTLDEIYALLRADQGIELPKDLMRDLEMGREVGGKPRGRWEEACMPLAGLLVESVGGELLRLPDVVDSSQFRDRRQKPDTIEGWDSVRQVADRGVEYWVLLYQRYVGGFFRQAMDASSSIKADILEGAVVRLLTASQIPFYRTRPREKLPQWEQAPDFLLPNEEKPSVVIEAKLAEDGGTARDKAARIERLCREARHKRVLPIAVIDGKGFYRVNDVTVPILKNTQGETYTLKTLPRILEIHQLAALRGKAGGSR